ncbi:MAG: DUF4258 domain-containing protein, partial [Eubacteriales bacterium]|nr:DUF4258 domain-containing protein [Eubacteriales bacterium]
MNIINPNLINNNFNNIKKNDTPQANLQETKSFKEILGKKAESNIQFSKHASMRLDNRNLTLSNSQMKRIEQGIEKAKEKGINDSLVLVDNIALVVNVKKNIVITAIQNDNEK